MSRAVMPGSTRIHCYLADEEARRDAEVVAFCDEIANQFSVGALVRDLGTFIVAIAAAAAIAFG